MDINAVENRSGNFTLVFDDRGRAASAKPFRISRVSAGTGIHGGNEGEASRKRESCLGARDADLSVFQWLAEIFQNGAAKLRKLVEKQHAPMRKTDLTGFGELSSTDERNS